MALCFIDTESIAGNKVSKNKSTTKSSAAPFWANRRRADSDHLFRLDNKQNKKIIFVTSASSDARALYSLLKI